MPVDEVCGKCRLKGSKPESCPSYLIELVNFLETLAGRHEMGLTFNADTFTPEELAAIDGKARARARQTSIADIKRRRKDATKNNPGVTGSSLERVLGRPLRRM